MRNAGATKRGANCYSIVIPTLSTAVTVECACTDVYANRTATATYWLAAVAASGECDYRWHSNHTDAKSARNRHDNSDANCHPFTTSLEHRDPKYKLDNIS